MSLHGQILNAIEEANTTDPDHRDLIQRLLLLTADKISHVEDYDGPTAEEAVERAFREILEGSHDHLYSGQSLFAFFGAVILKIVARNKAKKRRAMPN